MNTTLLIIIIVAAVIALGIGGILFVKKFGANYIEIAKSLVSLIKVKMNEYNFGVEKFDTILDFILQGLSYVQAMSAESTNISDKVTAAHSFIQNLISQSGIKLDENETEIIKSILKGGFIFMDSLGITATSINVNNYLKLYKSTLKHSGGKVSTIVGLRKSIK